MHNVVLIEYDMDGRPFSVVVKDERDCHVHYDVEWCKRDQQFLYSGSSNSVYLEHPDNTFWATDEAFALLKTPPTGTRLVEPSPAYPMSAVFDEGSEVEAIWCSVCEDWLPEPHGDDVCPHVRWCEECGW